MLSLTHINKKEKFWQPCQHLGDSTKKSLLWETSITEMINDVFSHLLPSGHHPSGWRLCCDSHRPYRKPQKCLQEAAGWTPELSTQACLNQFGCLVPRNQQEEHLGWEGILWSRGLGGQEVFQLFLAAWK